MRNIFIFSLFLTASCQADEAPPPVAVQPQSSCAQRLFENDRFIVCEVKTGAVELRFAGPDGQPLRSFGALEAALGDRSDQVAFAMNAGMFDDEGRPIGLAVADGKQLRAINRRRGFGNFHLLPNGVFQIRRDGTAAVVTSEKFKPSPDIAFATQSGPMLLIDGKLHPKFEPDGASRLIRNAVGIAPDGKPLFLISEGKVSFGKLARFARDQLKVRDALYFDGSVSSLWDPANARRDSFAALGPLVVAFKPAEPAPGP